MQWWLRVRFPLPADLAGNAASLQATPSGLGSHAAGTPATTQLVPSPAQAWQYTETKDQMRGIVTSYATVQSTNQLDFDFPYRGGSTVTLLKFWAKKRSVAC